MKFSTALVILLTVSLVVSSSQAGLTDYLPSWFRAHGRSESNRSSDSNLNSTTTEPITTSKQQVTVSTRKIVVVYPKPIIEANTSNASTLASYNANYGSMNSTSSSILHESVATTTAMMPTVKEAAAATTTTALSSTISPQSHPVQLTTAAQDYRPSTRKPFFISPPFLNSTRWPLKLLKNITREYGRAQKLE